MLSRILFLIVGFMLWAASSFLSAQETPDPLYIDFHALAWDQFAKTEELYFDDGSGKAVSLKMHHNRRQGSYTYHDPNPIIFFHQEKQADGSTIRIPVAQVNVPPNVKKPLLLFFDRPNSKEGEPKFFVYPLNDSISEFPPGSYLFFTLTKDPLLLRSPIKNTEVVLEPTQTFLFKPNLKASERLIFNISDQFDTFDYPANRFLNFFHDPRQRTLIFLYTDQVNDRRSIRIKIVPST